MVTIEKSGTHVNDGTYNVYYNGNIAVSHETLGFCEAIKIDLEKPLTGRFYSEGAEIADRVRSMYLNTKA